MEGWHWSLESRRSVLARLSWIEQAATRSRATVSPWMSVAANGPETDCAWSCAAEDARHAGEAARVGAEDAFGRPMMLGTRPSTPGAVTAEALSANLEQMKSVEQLRRVYRDLKDLKNPDSN